MNTLRAIKDEAVQEGRQCDAVGCSFYTDEHSQLNIGEDSGMRNRCKLILKKRTRFYQRVVRFKRSALNLKSARTTRLSDKTWSSSWCRVLWKSVIIVGCYILLLGL